MALLPLDWVVIDAPATRTEHLVNGAFARVMWIAEEGPVLRLVDEGGWSADAWQIKPLFLVEVCPWPATRFD